MSINRVAISGNLTRDAELRSTQSGTSVLKFGVAVNDRRKNSQTGEWEDVANFFDCTMFGTRAQSIASYLVKGTKVTIDGKLRWSQWENEGQKRSKVEIIVDDIDFASSRNGGNQQFSGGYGTTSQNNTPSVPDANTAAPAIPTAAPDASGDSVVDTNSSVYDEDIPF